MGGAISGITGAVSGIIGGIGTNKALNQQEKALNQQKDQYRQGYATASGAVQPYVDAGQTALGEAGTLAGQTLDRNSALQDFFGGQEYQTLSNAANRSALASAEATGSLGGSTMQNRLGAITAQLGQNYLNDMYNQQQQQFQNQYSLAGMGLQAGNALGNFAMGNANAMSGLYGQQGQVKAAKAALPYQVAANANSSIGNGAASDVNQFGGMAGSLFGMI